MKKTVNKYRIKLADTEKFKDAEYDTEDLKYYILKDLENRFGSRSKGRGPDGFHRKNHSTTWVQKTSFTDKTISVYYWNYHNPIFYEVGKKTDNWDNYLIANSLLEDYWKIKLDPKIPETHLYQRSYRVTYKLTDEQLLTIANNIGLDIEKFKLDDTENVKDSNTKKKEFTDKHSYPVIGTAVLTQDFEDLGEIVGKKGEVVELSEDYDEIFDAYKIVIDGTRFYASPREIEDIRMDNSRKVKDSKDKCSYVLKTGVRSDAFKQYLRDRGLKFEPSQDREYTHFVVFNADEAVDRRVDSIIKTLKDKKFGDAGFSKEDVEDAVWFFEGELDYINGSKKFKEDDEDDEHQHIVAQMSMRGWNGDFERAVRKKYWDLENIPLKEAVRKIITWLRSIKEE